MAQPRPHPDAALGAAPRLVWAGCDDTRVVLCDDDGAPRLHPRHLLPVHRMVERQRLGDGGNLLIRGENYHALDTLLREGGRGSVKLVYIDPPFNTGHDFKHYRDALDLGLYLSWLRDRLRQLHELLALDGTIVVHLDDRRAPYVQLLLDEVFGPENFRNSIVVKRIYKNLQRQFSHVQCLPRAHDVCLVYSRTPAVRYPLPLLPKPDGPRHPEGYWKDFWSTAERPTMRYELLGVRPIRGQWKWRRERAEAAVANYRRYLAENREETLVEHWRREGCRLEFIRRNDDTGKVCHWVAPDDRKCADTLWTDFCAYAFRQRFPTEKNELLVGRFIELFSAPGELVLDCFAGSGTSGAAATRLGRRWILVERGRQAETHILPRLAPHLPGFRYCELEPA